MNRGMMALVMVLIIGAAALVLAVSLNLRTIGNLELAETGAGAAAARLAAEGCLETALIFLKRDPDFAGGIVGDCDITISSPTVDERLIVARATVGNYDRQITATVSLAEPRLKLLSWSEE